MKKKQLLFLIPFLLLIGCTNENPVNQNEDETQEDVEKEYETFSVDFTEDYIIQCDSSANNFSTNMLTNLNHNNQIATSTSATGFVQINNAWMNKNENTYKALTLSSRNLDSEWTINFPKTLHSVSLRLSPYAKWIPYSSLWSTDESNKFIIGTEEITLPPMDTTLEEPPLYTYTFEIDSLSLIIKGVKNERVIVHSVDFTFEKTND